jgi:hypothetical protein
MKKISQREAKSLRVRVLELERILEKQKDRWASDWSEGWINIATVRLEPVDHAKIKTARLLHHAVVALPEGTDIIRFYAESLK